jgi:hypothetical protein
LGTPTTQQPGTWVRCTRDAINTTLSAAPETQRFATRMDHRPFSNNGKNANDGHAAQKQVSRDAQQQRQRLLQPKSRLQMTQPLLASFFVGWRS